MSVPAVLGTARRVALVVGAGALGAAVCSAGVHLALPSETGALRTVRTSATPSSPPRVLGAGERRAVELLRRAGWASTRLAYSGSKLFGGWSAMGRSGATARVTHRPGEGTVITVTSGAPERGTPGMLQAEGAPELDGRALAALIRRYTLGVAGHERLLGRPVTVVEARRADGVVAGRFWVDDACGLLLQRRLYDGSGAQVGLAVFIDLTVGPSTPTAGPTPFPDPSALPRADGGRVLAPADLAALRATGLVLPDVLPSGLALVSAREMRVGSGRAVQLGYSDGLFGLSLFAQRGRLDTDGLDGYVTRQVGGATVHARSGLYRHLTWAGGDTVYTVVTDAPDAVVGQVVAALPHRAPERGVLARMSRGVARMGSWADPSR